MTKTKTSKTTSSRTTDLKKQEMVQVEATTMTPSSSVVGENKKRKRQRSNHNQATAVPETAAMKTSSTTLESLKTPSNTTEIKSDECEGDSNNDKKGSVVTNSSSFPSSSKSQKRNKRRRRSSGKTETEQQHHHQEQQHQPRKQAGQSLPLQGITVAVSTQNNLEQDTQPPQQLKTQKSNVVVDKSSSSSSLPSFSLSYNVVSQQCRELGAIVSGQVHKRLYCVICTPSAIQQGTQRVRKAVKRGIPLVHIDWIQQCHLQRKLIDIRPYLLEVPSSSTDVSKEDNNNNNNSPFTSTKTSKKTDKVNSHDNDNDDNCEEKRADEADDPLPENNSGWSDPVACGCCCVCHEMDTANDCPWCQGQPCCTTTTTIPTGMKND